MFFFFFTAEEEPEGWVGERCLDFKWLLLCSRVKKKKKILPSGGERGHVLK